MPLIELATISDGNVGAVASTGWRPQNHRKEEDHLLRMFDLDAGRCILEFPVLWDGGGRRLAFSRDGSMIYVGCYDVHGLACYSTETGAELWRRKDLKSVQQVYASMMKDQIFCGKERGACPLLDGRTGQTVLLPRGVKAVWFSDSSDMVLVERGKRYDLEFHRPLGKKVGRFSRRSFAVNHVAFSPGLVVLAEPNEPLRAITLKGASEIWRFPQEDAHRCHALAYSKEREAFVACFTRDQHFELVTISPDDGSRTYIATVAGRGTFYRGGESFVDNDGSTYSVTTGQKLTDKVFGIQ